MKRFTTALIVGMLMAGASLSAAAADEPKKDLFLKGDARCTQCHDEADSPQVLAVGKTKHGVGADKRTPTCSSCHGDSDAHVKDAGRAGKESPKVDVGYSKKNPATAEQRNEKCLTCHQGGKRVTWQMGTHANRDVACTNCHKIHDGHDAVRDKSAQSDVCFACHKEQRSQVAQQSHHPIPEGKVSCSSCHEVHGDQPKMMKGFTVNETCYACHMEKRGPFVHNHQPVSEDCSICHNPHGSNISNLLKARPPFLCQECHQHSSHPGQLAGLPTAAGTSSGALGTVARGCLNCHTNIHGGNSTVNNATAGRFRR